jgi:hypothetical protein
MIERQDKVESHLCNLTPRRLDSDGSQPDLRLSNTRKQRNGCIRTGEINDV